MSGSLSLFSLAGVALLAGWYVLVFLAIRRMRRRLPVKGAIWLLMFVLLVPLLLLLGFFLVVALSFDK